MEKKQIKRVFMYKDEELMDPNASFLVKDVKKHYSGTFPELATADVEGPKYKGGKHVYTFKTSVGTKG